MNKLAFIFVLVALFGCSEAHRTSERAPAGDTATNFSATSHAPLGSAPSVAGAASPFQARTRGLRSFASMPDRGELVSYQAQSSAAQTGKSVLHEGAYTWHRVTVSEEHALRGIVDGHLRVPTPSGRVLDFRYDYHVEHPSGDLSWAGYLEGEPGIRTILTFGANAVFGRIGQPGKRALRLTVRNGAAWLVETDPLKLALAVGASDPLPDTDTLAVPLQRKLSGLVASRTTTPVAVDAQVSSSAAAATDATTTIDLLVGYTPGFVAAQTGASVSAALTRLNAMVAVANDALSESQTGTRIRLVHAMQVSYTDDSANDSALEQLTGYDSEAQDSIPPNAAFNALRAARETYGADLVTLVRDFRKSAQEGCGIAWLIGGGRSGVTAGDGQEYFGYSVVGDGYDGNYFCREETLAHELAHNMGSQHDREEAKGDDGTLDSDEYGAYSYSFGLKVGSSAGNFYTIMAYGDEGQQDYPFFSNPRIDLCGTRSCGTTSYEDNARSLSQLAPRIAEFRAARSRPYVRGDVNGDAKADLLWGRPDPSQLVYWLMDGTDILVGKSFAVSSTNRTIGTGDLDGNGKLDVVRMNDATGDVYVMLGSGSSFISRRIGNRAGWVLIGTGDVNSDGKSDLLWSRRSTGQFVHWMMEGSVVSSGRSFNVSPSWRGVGVGDLDGNGQADVVWKNDANGGHIYVWSASGSGYRVSPSIGRRIGWSLLGVRDVNGDGKDDLLWAKPGYLVRWLMSGPDILIGKSYAVNESWRAIGAADYDGNGKADIAWKNDHNGGHVYIWMGNGTGFVSSDSIGRRIGWTLLPY